ncbi:MAG TPA: beta-N-acetylglucosaminidase domain-containing protein [Melioribacteraceae bacterium]|nr:beta-N-acetylglucosaminidase domain-containing protein [Melioribacteraceae bacterium]
MKKRILILLLFLSVNSFSQELINSGDKMPEIQPAPVHIKSLGKSVLLSPEINSLKIIARNEAEIKSARYINYLLKNKYGIEFSIENPYESKSFDGWVINISRSENNSFNNNQHYRIIPDISAKEINISSPGQLGLLFGVATFSEFIERENSLLKLNLFEVDDWPEYSRRIFSTVLKPGRVEEIMNYALMNKMETIAIASRVYSWFRIDDEYQKVLDEIKDWRDRFGGPEIMQSHNIYEKKQIEISNPDDINLLKSVIEAGLKIGIEKIMILADDTPPFKYHEGYTLTSENDKKKFSHMAEAHCYLINDLIEWLDSNSYKSEVYYVPAFYTYEDMNYGDMELYKNTPWEKEPYGFLKQDLNFIGSNMNEDVYIIWCGVNVRSRSITVDQINDWSLNLKGRVPFLWDNTIYSHHPFTSAPLFSAYSNELPGDFSKRTAGNGMFVNGNADAEDSKASIITVNDFLWNSSTYDSLRSIQNAMIRLYGKASASLLFEFKETELEFRKKIGERKLWFEADTLWSIIRKIRYIHDKNPFHYHFNYTRMKALRLQLKNSVPEPVTKEKFVDEIHLLDGKRNGILRKMEMIDKKVYEKIIPVMLPVPDYNIIQ